MAAGTEADDERWRCRGAIANRYLPYVLLVVSALLAAAIVADGWSSWERYGQLLAVAGVIAALTYWCDTRHASWTPRPPHAAVYYAVRWALTAVLVLGNPFFGIFAFIGYMDALRFFPYRRAVVGIVATALLTTTSQAAGLPPATVVGVAGFLLLWTFNAALASGLAYGGVLVERQSEERRTSIEELVQTNARLAEALRENAGLHAQLLAQAREAGTLDERARLAREIHDTLAQGLTGIVTQLQAVDRPADEVLARRIGTATRLARESLTEARRSVHALAPSALERADLAGALHDLATDWSSTTGTTAQVLITGTAVPLHPEVEAALLRTAQEALANVARHAAAGRVALTLSYMDDVVTLDVRDDGRGFTPALARPPDGARSGFGLTAMRQRLALVAGSLVVESEPGAGTALSATVPAVPASAEPLRATP